MDQYQASSKTIQGSIFGVFIYFGFNVAFNRFDRTYHDGRFIGRGNQCRVVGHDFCTVNYRPPVSQLQYRQLSHFLYQHHPTGPYTGKGLGIEPTPAGLRGECITTETPNFWYNIYM